MGWGIGTNAISEVDKLIICLNRTQALLIARFLPNAPFIYLKQPENNENAF